jgi:hypothetical protein
MITGRRATDWLAEARCSTSGQGGDTRRGSERRANDRRAPRRTIDTLFAASLINQIEPDASAPAANPYRAISARIRAGIITDGRC